MSASKFAGLLAAVLVVGCDTGLEPSPDVADPLLDPSGVSIASVAAVGSRATGSGITSDGASVRAMTFSAHTTGAATLGQYNLVLNGNDRRLAGTRGHLQGNVTCLRVVGNRAFIAGDTRTNDLEALPIPIGGVVIEVVDGGEGPSAVDEISSIGLFLTLEAADDWCATASPGPTFEAEAGQVQVR